MAGTEFGPEVYRQRCERATVAAREAGLAALVLTPGPDLAYLSGYTPPADTERLTALVLTADAAPTLVVPALERPAAELAPAARSGPDGLSFVDFTDGVDPYRLLADLLPAAGRLGVSDSAWALHLLGLQRTVPELRWAGLSEALPMLRAVKEPAELARLAAAGAAADATYEQILGVRFAGRRERDVAADLAAGLRAHGHEQVDFTIVGSGPNGASPHHEPTDRVIAEGDTVVLDFGGLRDGYGSDTTRTVHVGEPGAEVREVHEVVRAAQQAAFDAVAPGVPCEYLDEVARRVIAEAGYAEHFIHRTGHGIGTTTHEPPYLVTGEKQPLVPGMCFSIEPGIYLPGRFGVRIEDIVTVTESGGRRFNDTSRALQVVR
ncbi:dipeptidase [Actinocatenispora thailandica]|uniref:Dipeptidase n=1 Tax=Actinocatenispora thailandica TaxID=227318 RepID=A0A7R7DKQ2_9ACTN|nr:aminopeptidase P family protein [Actinocatenispora thailandica]BCJ33305.1 dipeptidase [Actinocatenispora thailandica]